MSGRVRHTLADGRRVTGYRKTLARRPRLAPPERLQRLAKLAARRATWPVRMGFLLPKDTLLSSGPHGPRVYALRSYVQVCHRSAEECFVEAEHFLRDVAHEHAAFTTLAIITREGDDKPYFRNLTVVNGALVVSAASVEPKVYGQPRSS